MQYQQALSRNSITSGLSSGMNKMLHHQQAQGATNQLIQPMKVANNALAHHSGSALSSGNFTGGGGPHIGLNNRDFNRMSVQLAGGVDGSSSQNSGRLSNNYSMQSGQQNTTPTAYMMPMVHPGNLQ